MKNKGYKILIRLAFGLTMAFLLVPLVVLAFKGAGYIPSLIRNEEVIFSIALSFKSTIITTIICLCFAIPSAVYLSSLEGKKQTIFKNLLFLPLSLPHLVSGIALLFLFGNLCLGKYINQLFGFSFIYTQKGIVLAQVFVNLPLTIKIILQSLEEINSKMLFVARTLGCSSYECFRYVILPSLKSGIISGSVLTWSKALGEFGAVLMVAGSTRMRTEILPTAIFLNMSTGDVDSAIGVSVILIIFSLASLFAFELITGRNKDKNKKQNNYYV